MSSTTPWREFDGVGDFADGVVFIRDGHKLGDRKLLAEALRTDGVAANLYEAFQAAESASYELGYYGYLEHDRVLHVCGPNGETLNGEQVEQPLACVFATVDI